MATVKNLNLLDMPTKWFRDKRFTLKFYLLSIPMWGEQKNHLFKGCFALSVFSYLGCHIFLFLGLTRFSMLNLFSFKDKLRLRTFEAHTYPKFTRCTPILGQCLQNGCIDRSHVLKGRTQMSRMFHVTMRPCLVKILTRIE